MEPWRHLGEECSRQKKKPVLKAVGEACEAFLRNSKRLV